MFKKTLIAAAALAAFAFAVPQAQAGYGYGHGHGHGHAHYGHHWNYSYGGCWVYRPVTIRVWSDYAFYKTIYRRINVCY
jgi:hypothetical protein